MRASWARPCHLDGKAPVACNAEKSDPCQHLATRIPLCQAVTVRFTASGHYEFTGISRDISASGIFLYAQPHLEKGAQVEVMLTLPSGKLPPVSLHVRGKVVRVEESSPTGIAIAFDRLVIAPEILG